MKWRVYYEAPDWKEQEQGYEKTMTPDERKELRQKALKSLEAQGFKIQFITDMLIEAEENKILKEELK